jgi:rhodanese-related sulfurtransferase
MKQVNAGGRWIDVRLPSEYERSHIPGAINIPMISLHKSARDLARDVTYVCYCKTGRRSSAAAFVFNSYGLRTSVLRGGIEAVNPDLLEKP